MTGSSKMKSRTSLWTGELTRAVTLTDIGRTPLIETSLLKKRRAAPEVTPRPRGPLFRCRKYTRVSPKCNPLVARFFRRGGLGPGREVYQKIGESASLWLAPYRAVAGPTSKGGPPEP